MRSYAANMSARIDVLLREHGAIKRVGLGAITMDGDIMTPYSGNMVSPAVWLPKGRREAPRLDNFSH